MGASAQAEFSLFSLIDRSSAVAVLRIHLLVGGQKKKREREGRGGEGRGGVQVVAVAAEQYRWFLLLLLFLFSRLVLHDLANVALRGIKTTPEAAFSL